MYFNTVESCADIFIKNSHENIETIFQPYEFQINFKIDNLNIPKTCYVLAEKINDKEIVQIRVAEKNERKMYTSTINIQYFNILKKNQSLHVTFFGFIDNLLKILQECQKENLKISIIQRDKENEILLQFYEMHSFKNLIHLSLPIEEASLAVVNFHLYRIIEKIQKQTYNYESTVQALRNEIKNCSENFSEIKRENNRLRDEISQQKQAFLRKQKSELDEMQNKMKDLMENKESDENQYKKIISQLQSKIDFISLEKANAIKERSEELKKSDNLRKELSQLKSTNCNLKQSKEQLIRELDSMKSNDNRCKFQVNNLNKKLSEYEAKVLNLEKLNSELQAELQAEKKLCHAKRNALEVASEEITKANDIIGKQSVELSKLKKTINWRTEVALQQEKSIERKEKTIINLNNQIAALQEEFRKIRSETMKLPIEITEIKHMAESIEDKYNKKILEIRNATKS